MKDLISCGPNRTTRPFKSDTLDFDLADGTPPADCETVTQGALLEGANVRMRDRPLRPRPDRRMGVRLRCPASVEIGCNGRLRLRLLPARPSTEGSAAASRRYRLDAGDSRRVLLRCPTASAPRCGARAVRHA